MRRRAKADANQQQIVRELRALGMSVRHTHTIGQVFPDLAVGWRGVTLLVELKVDGGRLSADEAEFFKAWRGAHNAAQQSAHPTVLAPCACGGERQLLTRCQKCRALEAHSG